MKNVQTTALIQAAMFALGPIVEQQSDTITGRFAEFLVDETKDTETQLDDTLLDGLCGVCKQFIANVETAKATYETRKVVRDAEAAANASVDTATDAEAAAAATETDNYL